MADLRVFVSYRRADAQYVAPQLQARLAAAFGEERVFFDAVSIGLGEDFRSVIRREIRRVDAVLVLIGTRFQPGRLLDDDDPVRLEIKEALEQQKLLVPVLFEDAEMPAPGEVPAVLRPFCDLNAARLRPYPDFDADIERLVTGLRRPTRPPTTPPPAPAPTPSPAPPSTSLTAGRSWSDTPWRRLKAAAAEAPANAEEPPAPQPPPAVRAAEPPPASTPAATAAHHRGLRRHDFLSDAWMDEFVRLRNEISALAPDGTWGTSITDQHDLSFRFVTESGRITSWERSRGGTDLVRTSSELWTDLASVKRPRFDALRALVGNNPAALSRAVPTITGGQPPRVEAAANQSSGTGTKAASRMFSGNLGLYIDLSLVVSLVLAVVALWMLVGVGPGTGGLRQPSIRETVGTVVVGLGALMVMAGIDAGPSHVGDDVDSTLAINLVAWSLLYLGFVPLLRVGYVDGWAVVILAATVVFPALCVAARPWPSLARPLAFTVPVLNLALAALVLGTAQAVVGDTEGVFGTLGRIVDDGSF